MSEDVLSGYLDGELTPAERDAVEARLSDSAEWRAALADVAAARDSVRALPVHEAPPGFWAALLAAEGEGPVPVPSGAGVVDLAARRSRSRRIWTAVGGAAAAAVIAAVLLVPTPDRVRPELATFVDAHAVQSSLRDEPVTHLVSVGAFPGFRR